MSVICQLRNATACFLCVTAVYASDNAGRPRGGYLATIGPVPLRFLSLPDHAHDFVQLPLLAPVKTDSVPATPSSEQTEPVNPFALSDLLAPAADTNSVIMEAASPAPIIPATPQQDQQPISPRVFLQYFNAGNAVTNPPAANPPAPVDFTPPHSSTPGRATFTPSP